MRWLYVVPEVIREIEGKGELRSAAFAQAQAFLEGGSLTYSFNRRPDAMMRRLAPRKRKAPPDVWEMRIRYPRPGARIYGLFAGRNIFIGTEFVERDQTSGDMSAEILRSRAVWQNLFQGYPAIVSEQISEYLDAHVHKAI